jgi:hypothetical protein
LTGVGTCLLDEDVTIVALDHRARGDDCKPDAKKTEMTPF